jgi:hypothetical protein
MARSALSTDSGFGGFQIKHRTVRAAVEQRDHAETVGTEAGHGHPAQRRDWQRDQSKENNRDRNVGRSDGLISSSSARRRIDDWRMSTELIPGQPFCATIFGGDNGQHRRRLGIESDLASEPGP